MRAADGLANVIRSSRSRHRMPAGVESRMRRLSAADMPGAACTPRCGYARAGNGPGRNGYPARDLLIPLDVDVEQRAEHFVGAAQDGDVGLDADGGQVCTDHSVYQVGAAASAIRGRR